MFIKASKLVPMSIGVMFALMFSITYESWLVSSLNPYTIIVLIIITIVSEAEIVEWEVFGSDATEVIDQEPEVEPTLRLGPV